MHCRAIFTIDIRVPERIKFCLRDVLICRRPSFHWRKRAPADLIRDLHYSGLQW